MSNKNQNAVDPKEVSEKHGVKLSKVRRIVIVGQHVVDVTEPGETYGKPLAY